MARYAPFRRGGYSRRRYRGSQMRSSAGQGRMKADFSGNQELIRHTVTNTIVSPYPVMDGKAIAAPLLVFTGDSNNNLTDANESVQATYAEGSRVNHIQTQLTITQEDATKPNNCYIGFISVSFSDAMLDVANMQEQFASLIGLDNSGTVSDITTNGEFYSGALPSITPRDLTIKDYLGSSRKRHWIRGLAKNKYTLYSGRPLVMNQVFPVPSKNKRGQFGSGYFMVILNESGALQGEEAGDGTDINVSITSFYKEIPIVSPPVTP